MWPLGTQLPVGTELINWMCFGTQCHNRGHATCTHTHTHTHTQTLQRQHRERLLPYTFSLGACARAVYRGVLMKRSGEKKEDCVWNTLKPMPVYVASLLRREGQTETCRLQIFTHSNLCCCHVLGSSALVSVCSVSRVLSVTACVFQAWKPAGGQFSQHVCTRQTSGLEY